MSMIYFHHSMGLFGMEFWPSMNQHGKFFVQTSAPNLKRAPKTLPPTWKNIVFNTNQLPTKSPIECKDNSILTTNKFPGDGACLKFERRANTHFSTFLACQIKSEIDPSQY